MKKKRDNVPFCQQLASGATSYADQSTSPMNLIGEGRQPRGRQPPTAGAGRNVSRREVFQSRAAAFLDGMSGGRHDGAAPDRRICKGKQ